MTTLIPTSQPTGVETYEDMFKEITRKLYGEESAHGLYPHNTQVVQVAQLGSGATAAPEGGERSFTTLVSDRSLTQIDYETPTVSDQQQQGVAGQQAQSQQQPPGGTFKTEDHLTTAFGLAALMQNGFPPPGAILNPVNFPVSTSAKTSTNITTANTSDDRWQQTQQQSTPQEQPGDQIWNTGKHSSSSSFSQKPFKKPKVEPQDNSPTTNGASTLNIPQAGTDKKGNFTAAAAVGAATGKRYSCTSCPYTTDRRDLFTRHENIHKEEKPFHCYACLKQFNRADHVKKHFLRMHRDMEYEIAKTRRTVSTKSYYNNGTNTSGIVPTVSAPAPTPVVSQPQTIQANTLNIPQAAFPTQITIPSHHVTIEHSTVNTSTITTLNGAIHHVTQHQNQQQQQAPTLQHQQQQQQPQQTTQIIVAPPIVAIKQEKGTAIVTNNNSNIVNSSINSSNTSNMVDEKPFAKKGKSEKRFTCCYCPWSGADNWGLKRHLNTHTKPFVCMLCDYKAARSERLATHVFKVHNKKACNKCNYFAEDQEQLNAHQLEVHLLNMQAIGRNKASVTQDFHNAGGGNHYVSNNSSNSNSSSSSNSTNKLSLLVAASSSASCSPSSSPPWCSPALATAAVAAMNDCSTKQNLHNAMGSPVPATSLTEEHLSLLQLLATAAVAQQQHLQQQKATSMTTNITTPPPANHPPQQPNHHHHENSTNSQSQNSTADAGSKRRRKSSSRKDKENQDKIHRRPLPSPAVGTIGSGQKVMDLTTHSAGGPTGNGIERNNNSSNNNNSSVNNKNINETIFDRVYKKPYNNMMYLASAFCKPIIEKEENEPGEGKEPFSLAEFLRNHKEVSISTLSPSSTKPGEDEDVVFVKEEQSRKQLEQHKFTAAEQNTPSLDAADDATQIGDIRDKHMIRLITRRLCCRICQNQQRLERLDNCHYHSKTSLILHTRWRHGSVSSSKQCCKFCGAQFVQRYKLILHQRLTHRNAKLGNKTRSTEKIPAPAKKSAKGTSKKSKQRKQKKRKQKCRSGGKKRK
ncbi:uncharacterized protein LOC128734188 [Sabethes cyaneus]|uniref:uncharacterized protein LOC128734188 n=1 Tax=Sabethes cyaneus TaxID=53552 RepID=UPI00237D6527|nr:uncharacterized protein LOC128734188 [Sabethes cyaneus]